MFGANQLLSMCWLSCTVRSINTIRIHPHALTHGAMPRPRPRWAFIGPSVMTMSSTALTTTSPVSVGAAAGNGHPAHAGANTVYDGVRDSIGDTRRGGAALEARIAARRTAVQKKRGLHTTNEASAARHRPVADGLAKKVRQHVNPLSGHYAQPSAALADPAWFASAFAGGDATRPLTVDIGCAFGGWCVEAAALDAERTSRADGDDAVTGGERNFLGLEIRHTPAETAALRAESRGLTNCAFARSNANVDLANVVGGIFAAGAPLERVLVQFPDPWFKKRHRKRRVITPELAATIARALAESPPPPQREAGGAFEPSTPYLYLASDVLDVAIDMRETFLAEPTCVQLLRDATDDENARHGEETLTTTGRGESPFGSAPAAANEMAAETAEADEPEEEWRWLVRSPLELATEREAAVLKGLGATSTVRGGVFRAIFRLR